ncbi:MAG: hypothetical protein IJ008_01320 [Clostridia bacterium]|nr:hypothetical protein [Clostridia bacterium]
MALIKAKCTNCGANIKVDNASKGGICTHCGTSYITEDVIVNNITNINISENIDGLKLNRSAVLENMLLEYYSGRFNDIDNMKEYALKVQECDLNNVIARFVIFENIDSTSAIKKLLSNKDLDINFKLFNIMLNVCVDDLNDSNIINNIVKYKNTIDKSTFITEIYDNYRKKDFKFILNVIYNLKFEKDENTAFLEGLYNNSKVSKIAMLSQLKLFANSHKDFLYDEQKFDEYANHWKKLKEKQNEQREEKIKLEEKNKLENDIEKYKQEVQQKNKKKIIIWASIGGISLIGLVIFLLLI